MNAVPLQHIGKLAAHLLRREWRFALADAIDNDDTLAAVAMTDAECHAVAATAARGINKARIGDVNCG